MTPDPSPDSRIGIRAPEYFPRLEYFALMDAVDVFVIADTFQYSRQSFQNRARIRTPDGWQWISLPLMGGQHGTPIGDVRVANDEGRWRRKHWRSLEFNYRSTPYFEFFEAELRAVLALRSNLLCDYTCSSLLCVRDLLELRTRVIYASRLAGAPSTVGEIARVLGVHRLTVLADTVRRDRTEVESVDIVDPEPGVYRQNFAGFERGMSALDAIMNLGPRGARQLLRDSRAQRHPERT